MRTSNAKLWAGAALSALLLAGCGGGGGTPAESGIRSAPTMEQTITDVFAFISQLIASNGENTDPIDINPLTLATDDTSEPRSLE